VSEDLLDLTLKKNRKLFNRYQRLYGLSVEDLRGMLESQGNACAICLTPFKRPENPPIVDHDHDSGRIRGLLCRSCNWQLGGYETRKEEFELYLKQVGQGRPSRQDYFLAITSVVAKRGTCPRRKVGCILVVDNRIVAAGYNGAPKGLPHCDEVGCKPDGQGGCTNASHAELNALAYAARRGLAPLDGATCYLTLSPCYRCSQHLITTGIARVVFDTMYRDQSGIELLRKAGVETVELV
jgi:dCMP deaminase